MTDSLDLSNSPGFVPDMVMEGVDQSHIEALDKALHNEWGLGRNIVLVWVPCVKGMDVLIIPHYTISEYISTNDHETSNPAPYLDSSNLFTRQPLNIIEDVISGSKKRDNRELLYLSRVLRLREQRSVWSALIQARPVGRSRPKVVMDRARTAVRPNR